MDPIERRKAEHLEVSAHGDVGTRRGAGWDDIHLRHHALPEIDLDDVDLSTSLPSLGCRLAAPLVIAGMTGGHALARDVNATLARAAERFGLAMGVGSQRAGLTSPAMSPTYTVTREMAPSAFLIANVGVPQLLAQGPAPALADAQLHAAVDMIRADALALHLNFVQEAVQTEGERHAAGAAAAIARVVGLIGVPVIGKETGAGLSGAVAQTLVDAGVAALDVGGIGGTSFAAVEGLRAEKSGDARGVQLGDLLRDWGVPTAVSVSQAAGRGVPVIATGGVRNGLDAARALALGADAVGVARPLLRAVLTGGDHGVAEWIETFLEQLRTVLFLTGSRTPGDLRRQRPIILGETAEWLRQLGND